MNKPEVLYQGLEKGNERCSSFDLMRLSWVTITIWTLSFYFLPQRRWFDVRQLRILLYYRHNLVKLLIHFFTHSFHILIMFLLHGLGLIYFFKLNFLQLFLYSFLFKDFIGKM